MVLKNIKFNVKKIYHKLMYLMNLQKKEFIEIGIPSNYLLFLLFSFNATCITILFMKLIFRIPNVIPSVLGHWVVT